MMHMTFYWGKSVTILFDTWRTDTLTGYHLSLLALFVVSAFYQCIESYRIQVKLFSRSKLAPKSIEAPLLPPAAASRASAVARLAGATLFGINSAIGYLLMLVVMSFNGGVFLSVVVGLAVGYLAFRSEPMEEERDREENACA